MQQNRKFSIFFVFNSKQQDIFLMTVSTFYVEEFQILVKLSFKLKTSQINGNKTLTDIQNF